MCREPLQKGTLAKGRVGDPRGREWHIAGKGIWFRERVGQGRGKMQGHMKGGRVKEGITPPRSGRTGTIGSYGPTGMPSGDGFPSPIHATAAGRKSLLAGFARTGDPTGPAETPVFFGARDHMVPSNFNPKRR